MKASHLTSLFSFLICLSCWAQNSFSDSVLTKKVDSIIVFAIKQEAFPGAQILVAHKDSIVFHHTYGFHTYQNKIAVSKTDVYDLASVTKIIGPLPALMKLVDEGKLNLDTPFSNYWKPWKKKKDKQQLTLREILSHQAGLVPYIVFLNNVSKDGRLKKRFVKKKSEVGFNQKAYDGIYIKNRFKNKIYRIINRSKVSPDKKYKYSGLAFLLFPEIISNITGKSYEQYLQQEFYTPLGCKNLGFNPTEKEYPNSIVPTEIDTLFRKSLVKGYVHDENAALLGGVSGNAGLFGTADDLSKIMLMYQNYGTLNGKRYISEPIVKEFAKAHYTKNENRRGLGFDKPLLGNDSLQSSQAYPSPKASPNSFGHSGFTGTFVWADPKNQLVFIFLSNRVYPNRNHRKLYELNIRVALQDIFYSVIQ
ncbi:serine hydrolase [uncultured Croceitalea sp.]|uniref:serine hydrolase domain-containing protein n=1 Tax=uncultured Croceitalea sp. TaxID=1798908 RepID=UPI0033066298